MTLCLRVIYVLAAVLLSLTATAAGLRQAVRHTYRCRDVFGPLTPEGDIREWGNRSNFPHGRGPRKLDSTRAPQFVIYHPAEINNPSMSPDEITLFDFEDLVDDVQEAMGIYPSAVEDYVRLLYVWMSESERLGNLSPAKESSLAIFSNMYRLLYSIKPSYQALILARAMGTIFFNDGTGSLHQRVLTAARFQLIAKHGIQLSRWRELASESVARNTDRSAEVMSFVVGMRSRGYTAAEIWWALRKVITIGYYSEDS